MKKDLKIDESKGECICDVCGGEGSIDKGDWWDICWKCQGDGKLDWVSHITGKPMKPEAIFSTNGRIGIGTTSPSTNLIIRRSKK